jgi:hypothetical protein
LEPWGGAFCSLRHFGICQLKPVPFVERRK